MALSCSVSMLGTAILLAGAAAGPRATIVVDLTLLLPMPAPRLHSLMDESSAIWKPHGIVLEWITTEATTPVAGVRLRVLDEGRQPLLPCVAGSEIAVNRLASGRRLGATVFPQGSPGPASTLTLSVDATVRMVDSLVWENRPVANWPRSLRDHLVGRALGRVLAHEIGHVVLGVPFHTGDGLMQPEFRADQLVASGRHPFALAGELVPLLRARVTQLAGSGADPLTDGRSPLQLDASTSCR